MKTHDVPDNNVGKINGKTPEEIKKGLKCCSKIEGCKNGGCSYYDLGSGSICIPAMTGDALAYIQQLEAGIDHAEKVARECAKSITENLDKLQAKLIQVERERDELIRNHIPQTCDTCKYSLCFSFDNPCNTCDHLYRFNAIERGDTDRWEFVGVCPENTKEE